MYVYNPFTDELDLVDDLQGVTDRGATTTNISYFSTAIKTPKIYPNADSTTAIQFNKADGTTNVLDIDTTNGRVGIGTNAPFTYLDIKGLRNIPATSGQVSKANLRVRGDGGGTMEIGNAAGGNGWLQVTDWQDLSAKYHYHINPNGANVGIGIADVTSDPGYKLKVNGSLYATSHTGTSLSIDDTTSSVIVGTIRGKNMAPAASGSSNSGIFRLRGDGTGVQDFGQYPGGVGWTQITDVQYATTYYSYALNPLGGNVGIGCGNTISAKLHVIGTTEQLRLGYDASNYLSATIGSTGGVTLDAIGSGANFTFSDSVNFPYVAKTGNYTLTTNDYLVVCTANTFTITLPTAVGIAGRVYKIKNTGTGIITINTTSSQTIDNALTQTLNQWDAIEVVSDGANWLIT